MTSHHRPRRRALGIVITATLALAMPVSLASPAAPASATVPSPNAVIVWDTNAQTAIFDVAGQVPGDVASRGFAMVNGAVYDAVNAIAGTPYQPYLVAPRANGRESTDAAVATAAHRVLLALFPAQQDTLEAQYEEYLAALPDGRAKRRGIAIGEQTAAAMIAARADDGSFGDQLYPVGTEPGEWRPAPPNFGNSGGWLGHMRPFLIPDASMFRTDGPSALTSRAYARDVNEIKRYGSATSTVRTADQTEAARWWQSRRYGGWEIKRQLAMTQRLSVLETARLFATIDLTATDAAIACGSEKEFWAFWRPISAIHLADTDGNPRTKADPEWTPLLTTPSSPDYPSGNTCFTGAWMAAFESYFGRDDIAFSAFSTETGTRRHFSGFSDATAEVIEARMWGGIHLRTAGVNGAELGAAVADYVAEHHFQPTEHARQLS